MKERILISMGTVIVLAAFGIMAPLLTPRRYYFGLTVAPGFRESDAGRAIRRWYSAAIKIAAIFAAAVMIALPQTAPAAGMILVPLTTCVAFFYARNRVQDYSTPAVPVREAEISRAPERLPSWALLALPPFAILLCVAAYLSAHWDQIPARFPVHWGLDGQPNGWDERTPRGVYGPLWFGAAIMAMLVILGVASFYGSRRSAMRIAVLKILLSVTYLIAVVFGMVALLPLFHFSPFLFVVVALLFGAAVLAYSYKVGNDPDLPVDATPDSCWRMSSIYYNPADPALFVQKRIGVGYTLNFANPMSWLVVGVVLALIPVAIFLMR